jgi:hypothetical protein
MGTDRSRKINTRPRRRSIQANVRKEPNRLIFRDDDGDFFAVGIDHPDAGWDVLDCADYGAY